MDNIVSTILSSTVEKDWEDIFASCEEELLSCIETIAKRFEKISCQCIPHPSLVFRAFRECTLENLKVVILAQEPYPYINGSSLANGIALATNGGILTPTLNVIRQWLLISHPQYSNMSLDTSLKSWTSQGVLLINAALTCEPQLKDTVHLSHKKPWEHFVRKCLRAISNKKHVVFILMGNVASEYDDEIRDDNCIIKTEHPSSLSRKGYIIDTDPCFEKSNKFLYKNLKEQINWWAVFERYNNF